MVPEPTGIEPALLPTDGGAATAAAPPADASGAAASGAAPDASYRAPLAERALAQRVRAVPPSGIFLSGASPSAWCANRTAQCSLFPHDNSGERREPVAGAACSSCRRSIR